MSGQQSQGTTARLPKWSPNLIKQGPLKATIPMSGVLKPNSNIKTNQSPTTCSSYYKTRISPDHTSGQRSPGSSLFKGKSKQCTSDTIRRTASLDTLYLKGQWPRDNFYWHTGTLQIDKATQTDEADWSEATRKIHCISENDEKSDIFSFRGKLRGNNKDSNSRHVSPGEHMLNTSSQTLASCILSPTLIKVSPVNLPNLKPVVLPKSSIRSSVEGLNQEIERIVLKTGDTYCGSSFDTRSEFRLATPEGHRAPLADMLRNNRSRSVNTQTPPEFRGGGSCHSSGESHGSSPDTDPSKLGTSPHINKFLAREPPDGCEKVRLKSLDDKRDVPWEHAPQPSTFKLRPSLGSAFHILQPDLEGRDRQESPLVPSPDKSCN